MNFLKLTALCLLVFFLGCGGVSKVEQEKSAPENTAQVENETPPVATSKEGILTACLRAHSADEREYCECYAEGVYRRLRQMGKNSMAELGSLEKGQIASVTASACKR